MIPQNLIDSFDRYVNHGIPCGGFLNAVLSNDLMEAFGKADEDNRLILFDICQYIFNEVPLDCYGSREKVQDWIEKKRKEREGK